MKFQAPKGTRDFYPADMAVRNWIFDAWRRVSLRHGFEEYDAPIFESLDLYRAKSGDGIVSELFHFRDRGDREFAIRPEMTPTLARMIVAKAQSLARPIKWFSMPRLCRAERPQRGRLREFFQWNIDIVGTDDVLSDAECLLVAVDFYREIGLTPEHMVLKINSRSLLAALLEAKGLGVDRQPAIFVLLDKRDKVPADAFAKMVEEVGENAAECDTLLSIGHAKGEQGLAELASIASGNERAEGELQRLHELFALLSKMGVGEYCAYDMSVVRGLAYYTGIVFEGFGKGELKRAISGGGRYDELLKTLGGPPMSGIGFALSDVVVQDVLNDFNLLPDTDSISNRPTFFLIDADETLFPEVMSIAARLRGAGHHAAFNYRRQAIGKQFKQAGASGAGWAVIVGKEFLERQVVAIKNLKSQEQIEVAVDRFLADPTGVLEQGG